MANVEHVEVVRQGAEALTAWRQQNFGVRLDLNGVDLRGALLQSADLGGASLSRASLSGATLSGADLHRADLRAADLRRALLYSADLRGADLRDAHLDEAHLGDADLNGADLGGANLSRASLRGASLRGARLGWALLSGADLGEADLSEADLNSTDLGGANLGRARLSRADLRGADLGRADLSEADLGEVQLGWAYLDDANLSEANLHGANLSGALFHRADLSRADLSDADLGKADLSEANLGGARLSRANLHGADLSRANLREADLGLAHLRDANLRDAHLRDASIIGAIVGWTTFGQVDLSSVRGLETLRHDGPSTIGIDTLYRSGGNIPEAFLRGAGVPDTFVVFARSLVAQPLDRSACFISYSSQDQEFAERLCADLRVQGVRCWFAPEDLKVDDRFRDEIEHAIRAHDKLLLILSEHSVRSQWVEREAVTAMEREDRLNAQAASDALRATLLFPLRLDDAVLKAEPAWAGDIRRTRHIGDFTGWKDHDIYTSVFQRLLHDLTTSILESQA
jgi:uncharacterized protein YjbI with pentapeptide repeats